MTVVDRWTGRSASALRAALRMTNEAFANHLGAAVRTVANWEAKPDIVLSAAMQEVLDAALERSPDSAKTRFALLREDAQTAIAREADDPPPPAQPLTVSVAIVTRASEVLLVCRRDDQGSGLAWQFPAGVVKPGSDPATVAVRETLAETGVHCAVTKQLGRRLHPLTGVYCNYFHCEYLAGDADNRDVVENASVMWVQRNDVTRFIPEDRIYDPVLRKLLEDHETAAS